MENASTTSSDNMETTHQPYFASFQLKSQSPSLRRGNEKKRKKKFSVENDTITSIQQNGHKNRRRSSFLSVSSSMTSRSSKKTTTATATLSAKMMEEKFRLSEIRKELPVYAFKKKILEKIREKDVLLVMAETGESYVRYAKTVV